jgi:uncharacterized protein (TIGR02453 family)
MMQMPTSAFPGFPKQALTFFRQLSKNNTRAWFQPRKAQYEEIVRAPMLELCARVADDLRAFAAGHACEPKKALFRIYRDTRFSHDKTPYKTHIASVFPRAGMGKTTCAGFYFCVSHESVEIAAGMYMPGPEELAAVRHAIADDDRAIRRLLGDATARKLSGKLLGERLARVPKGFDADHPAADLLRMKQWYYDVTLPAEAALEPSIRKRITSRFRAMAPLVHYLNNVVLVASREEEDADEREATPKRPAPMF